MGVPRQDDWQNKSTTNEMLLRSRSVPQVEKAFKARVRELENQLQIKLVTACFPGVDQRVQSLESWERLGEV